MKTHPHARARTQTLPARRSLPSAGGPATLLLLALSLCSCATRGENWATAMDAPDGRPPGAITDHSQQRYLPLNRGVSKLSPYERDILRIAKDNYGSYINVSGWDRGLYYTGRLRVYRWGKHRDVPLEAYEWNLAAGERWHVIREATAGIAGLHVGSGMNPISGYHTARDMTLTMAGTPRSAPAAPTLPETPGKPEALEEPAPQPIQFENPILTRIDEGDI